MLNLRPWDFCVECSTLPGETVCLTGSASQLGEWKVEGVVPMVNKEEDESQWHCSIYIPANEVVSYRFCICTFVGPDQREVIVRRWESDLLPRKISVKDTNDPSNVSRFGFIHSVDRPLVQKGWLTRETVIQIKLHGEAVAIWKKKFKGKDINIKVTALDVQSAELQHSNSVDMDESVDIAEERNKFKRWPIIEVATLTTEDSVLRPQGQFGARYKDNGFIQFEAQLLSLPTVAFLVDFFTVSSDLPEHMGSCYLMPNQFKTTEGHIQVPILSKKFQPIGQFRADYLVVTPLEKNICDFEKTFSKHWKPHWKGLDVGHRGTGNSYTEAHYCSHIRENTIASLRNAINHGADMVEFDVQLSKDLVPVIYHDFEVCTAVHRKRDGQKLLLEMPLKSLTLEQLQQLKIHHVKEKSSGVKTFTDEEDNDHQVCPTLEQALTTLDESCGFNIEIKWDMTNKDGTRESHSAFEINLFVDTVLRTVLERGGQRKIVFSSFNPDVCNILNLKQNRYPVLFLSQGINSKYDDYLDPRTWTMQSASLFVKMADLLGMSIMAENLIRDPAALQETKERGQVVFAWTDDDNSSETVKYLKDLGVDGIIYDRMDVFSQKEVKKSIFSVESESQFMGSMSPTSLPKGFTSSPEMSPQNEQFHADELIATY